MTDLAEALRRALPRRVISVACFLMLGCMRWSAVPVNGGLPGPATLRLRLHDGGSVIMRNAVVRSDSIVGVPWGGAAPGARIAVAREHVERIDVGETDEEKTTALVFGIVVGTIGGLVWLVWYGLRHAKNL